MIGHHNRVTVIWAGYCSESQGLIEALTQRIIHEDRDLYPLAEREARTA